MHLGTLAPIDSRLLLTSPSLPTPHPHRASRCVIDSSSPLAHNPDQGKDRRPHGHMCRDPCVAVHVRVPRGTRTLRGGWREGWGGCVGLPSPSMGLRPHHTLTMACGLSSGVVPCVSLSSRQHGARVVWCCRVAALYRSLPLSGWSFSLSSLYSLYIHDLSLSLPEGTGS